jgi:hypothetical protein
MVVVDVLELDVLHGVELSSEDVVAGVAVVVDVGEAHVLGRKSGGEILARRDDESDAMAAQVGVGGEDAEREGGGEGLHRASGQPAETEWNREEGVAFELHGTIGQLKEAFLRDRGRAVEAEVGTLEAGEDEVVIGRSTEGHELNSMAEKDW